jgi:hypothetical protein
MPDGVQPAGREIHGALVSEGATIVKKVRDARWRCASGKMAPCAA